MPFESWIKRAGPVGGRWADESGAARMDRIVILVGLVVVGALLALSAFGPGDRGSATETAGAPAAAATAGAAGAERHVISAAGRVAPEPQRTDGAEVGPVHASASYMQRYDQRADTEQAILNAQTQRALAEEAAASEA